MKLAEIIINNPDISKINVPYIIAEAGVNHEGNFQNAINLIDLAADGGAHAIKFQTYKAKYIASVPLPTAIQFFALISLEKLFSNRFTSKPNVKSLKFITFSIFLKIFEKSLNCSDR